MAADSAQKLHFLLKLLLILRRIRHLIEDSFTVFHGLSGSLLTCSRILLGLRDELAQVSLLCFLAGLDTRLVDHTLGFLNINRHRLIIREQDGSLPVDINLLIMHFEVFYMVLLVHFQLHLQVVLDEL